MDSGSSNDGKNHLYNMEAVPPPTVPAPVLPAEVEEGNIEYKLKLCSASDERIEHLISQLKWRLAEGQGISAVYEIGVADDGVPVGLSATEMAGSLATLQRMASRLNLTMHVQHLRIGQTPDSQVAQVLLQRKGPMDAGYSEIRIGMLGAVGSGKSTTVGVLTTGNLDDGEGLARMHVSRHKHELDNGFTASVSSHAIGLDKDGKSTTLREEMPSSVFVQPDWNDIIRRTLKVVNFIDLAGHHRFLRSTLLGLTSRDPNYIILTIGINQLRELYTGSGIADRHSTADEYIDTVPVRKFSNASESDCCELGGGSNSSSAESAEDDEPNSQASWFCKHVKLCQSLQIPFCVAVTKCDSDMNAHVSNTTTHECDSVSSCKLHAEEVARMLESVLHNDLDCVGDARVVDIVSDSTETVMKHAIDGMCGSRVQQHCNDVTSKSSQLVDLDANGIASSLMKDHKCVPSSIVTPSSADVAVLETAQLSHPPAARCVPTFRISNVTGENIAAIQKFIRMLPVTEQLEHESFQSNEQVPVFHISEYFESTDTSTSQCNITVPVVGGTLQQGRIEVGDRLSIGPLDPTSQIGKFLLDSPTSNSDAQSTYGTVFVTSIRSGLNCSVGSLTQGQSGTLALEFETVMDSLTSEHCELSLDHDLDDNETPDLFGSDWDDDDDAIIPTLPSMMHEQVYECSPALSAISAKSSNANIFRRGLVITRCQSQVSNNAPYVVNVFEARIESVLKLGSIVRHRRRLKPNAQFTCFMNGIKQLVEVVQVKQTDNSQYCTLSFMLRPEYLQTGARFVLRNGISLIVGTVTNTVG